MKHLFNTAGYAPPTRAALLAHIAEARAKGDTRLAELGENALRRHDAMATRDTQPVSQVVRRETIVGVAPPASPGLQARAGSWGRYSFVLAERRRVAS